MEKNPWTQRKCSAFESKLIKNFKNSIKNNPDCYQKNMSEIMDMCGIEFDYSMIQVYNKVSHIFQKHRRYMIHKLQDFTILLEEDGLTRYQKCLSEGMNEKQIFEKFMKCCVDWNVIPVYSDKDDDWRYYLLTLPEWIVMIDQRISRMGKEFKNKIDILRAARDSFPKTTNRELKVLGHKPSELTDYLLED